MVTTLMRRLEGRKVILPTFRTVPSVWCTTTMVTTKVSPLAMSPWSSGEGSLKEWVDGDYVVSVHVFKCQNLGRNRANSWWKLILQVLEMFYKNYQRRDDQTKNFVFHPGPNKSGIHNHLSLKAMNIFFELCDEVILVGRFMIKTGIPAMCTMPSGSTREFLTHS